MLIKLEDYELYLYENEIAENTVKNYLNTLSMLNDFLEKNNVSEIEKNDLIRFKKFLKEVDYRPGVKYKISSINQKIICLNVYFNWVHQTTEHPLKLKKEKEQTVNHRESINEKDFKRLRKFASKEMDMFMLTTANTGLRISEVCAIKKSDLSKALIEIKNKGKSRTLDIPPFLKKQLLAWEHVKNLNDDDFIFNKTQQFYRSELKTIAGLAKVKKEKVYPHSFRHYFAKQFIASGGDSSDLQQMLGHSSIATTTIYTRKNKEELARTFRTIKNT